MFKKPVHRLCPSTWLQRLAHITRSPAYQIRQNIEKLQVLGMEMIKFQTKTRKWQKIATFEK